jgi:hypothetical protein
LPSEAVPGPAAPVEDPTERVTETAAPPFVAPRALLPADSQAEAEWFDSKDFESVREGPADGEDPAP